MEMVKTNKLNMKSAKQRFVKTQNVIASDSEKIE